MYPHTVNGGFAGRFATIVCKPRQARKGATVADDSGAGDRLAEPPPFQYMICARSRAKPSLVRTSGRRPCLPRASVATCHWHVASNAGATRQARKGATVADDSGAGDRLAEPPPLRYMIRARHRATPSMVRASLPPRRALIRAWCLPSYRMPAGAARHSCRHDSARASR